MAIKPHFLVTAGSTHEKIDDVRQWSNIFTGKTGLDVALALLDLGDVTLLTSNRQHAVEFDGFYGKGGMLGIETFGSHAELRDLLQERMTSGDRVDAVAMSAAVADYQPAGTYRVVKKISLQEAKLDGPPGAQVWVVENVQAPKVRSTHGEIAVLGTATEKLVDLFRTAWAFRGMLIKFKLEVGISDEELVRVAGESRRASGADLIIANTLAMVGGTNAGAYFIDAAGAIRVARTQLAAEMRERVVRQLGTPRS